MEENLKIPLGNNKFAYGILFGKLKKPLIIFVHGFTGNKNEHIFFNGARFFEKNRLASFRFDLYSDKNDARKLNDAPLSQNAEDLDEVIKFFEKKGINKTYVIGHSFGGVTVLMSKKQKFTKAVLWDPSGKPYKLTNEAKFIKELDLYFYDKWGVSVTIGKEMVEENRKINTRDLLRKIKVPTKIILAGESELKKFWKNEKNVSIIPGADHNFNSYGTEEKLFTETLNFLR